MPNGIRYATGSITGAMRKGFVALGIEGDLGPTSTTGFYSMPTPEAGKYIISKVSASDVPNFFAPQNDTELINLAKQAGATGTNTGSAAACLSYFSSQNLYYPANFDYPAIVTNGLFQNYDPAFVASYPTTGSILRSLASSTAVSLINGPTFFSGSSYGSGSFSFDGINDTSNTVGGANSTGPFTVSMWIYTNLSTNATYSVIGGISNTPGIAIIYSNGTQSLFISTSSGNSSTFNAGTDGNNGWVNYAITRDGSGNVTIYKNNVSLGSTNITGNFQLIALAKSPTTSFYNGLIGNILYYSSTALTTDQLTQNYNALKGRYGL
jgi:hypothetical protein